MSIYVYALKNLKNVEIYVGISKDPKRRLLDHNKGKNRYTKAFMPWTIFYIESHANYSKARLREKYFKSGAGKNRLRKILDQSGSLPA